MIQEIKYGGLTANPSDYESPNGDLAMSLGLVPEDGALKPVLPPKVLFSLGENQKVVFIHKNGNYKHYIVYEETAAVLYWKDGEEGELVSIRKTPGLQKIVAVGNVLVVSSAEGISYFLFKDGAYNYMGDGIPSLPVYFSLNGESRMVPYTDTGIQVQRTGGDTTTEYGPETKILEQEIVAHYDGEATYVDVQIVAGDRYRFYRPYYTASNGKVQIYYVKADGTETYWAEFSGQEWGNLLAGKNCARLKLCLFFLPNAGISYASSTIQIFHQEVIINTTPVQITFNKSLENFNAIMATCNRFIAGCHGDDKFIYPFFVRYAFVLYDGTEANVSPPILMIPNYKKIPFLPFEFTYTSGNSITVNAFAVACGLRMHIMPNELSNWKDIISGVNIYVTPPTFTYDQAATYEKWGDNMAVLQNINYNELFSISSEKGTFTSQVGLIRYENLTGGRPERYIDIPLKADYETSLMANQAYRKIKSYTTDEIVRFTAGGNEALVDIQLDEGTLDNINTLPELSGTNYVFNKLYASDIFSYNNRLVASTNTERMFSGYDPCELNGFYDDGTRGYYFVDVYVKSENGDVVVKTQKVDRIHPYVPFFWFYYPDPDAYKAFISKWEYDDSDGKYHRKEIITIQLAPHDYLPGAYWFSTSDLVFAPSLPNEMEAGEVGNYIQPLSDSVSKIQVSEVNNPFVFNPANTMTVGFGEIFAISSATKALSQGQFGQFPLYAFTSEGVWALEVSSTGTFSARQPVTRDVCINPDSITQIDSAVLFATDRGIMLISGSETVCLSDSVNSRDLFDLSGLPKAQQLVDVFNARAGEQERITLENASLIPYRDFLAACQIIYDYTGQRIIVFNPAVSYAYLYSLKSKAWGMMRSDIRSGINSYPEALAMVAGNKLADFSASDADAATALLVTRPFKLGAPDALKTIDTIIQRGYFRRGHIAQVLYASRDLFNWHIVWSSTDHYLRGFRGSPYKYFRLALICQLDKKESLYGCTVQFTPRLTNKPR